MLVEPSGLLSNPRVQDDPLVRLFQLCSELRFIDRAQKLINHLAELKENPQPPVSNAKPKQRQGKILETIKLVLLEHPDGLQTHEVRKLVEDRLGRTLPKSTIKDALASNKAFDRIGYGRYRLRADRINDS